MNSEMIIPIVLGTLLVGGASMLWTRRLLFGPYAAPTRSSLPTWLSIGGWLLVGLGVIASLAVMFHLLALLLAFVCLILLVVCLLRHWMSERKSLLWMLVVAAILGPSSTR